MAAKFKSRKSAIRKRKAMYPVPRTIAPYGRYNEDYYAAIQVNGTLLASAGTLPNQSQIQFRDDGTGTTQFQVYLGDVAEFTAKANSFYSYTVVSTRLVYTQNPLIQSSATLAAGNFYTVPSYTVSQMTQAAIVGLPVQAKAKQDGSASSLYYACEQDRKASGFQTGAACGVSYPNTSGCGTAILATWPTATGAGSNLGGYQFTWYVRFHGSRYAN